MLTAAVETELDLMESSGIIEVRFSEWGTPWCVFQRRMEVRLCGDYKTMVNSLLEVDQYPIPTPEQLFTALVGCDNTRLDLANAYQHLPLNMISRDRVTLHTHRGLYRYQRLPYCIASASAIFQQIIEQVLAGIDKLVIFLDEILITGQNTEENLHRLKGVLTRTEEEEMCLFVG